MRLKKSGLSLVISHTLGDTSQPTKVVIKNGTKLGQILNKLPHGIINKNHTGIGATTVELRAKRNSILVEPLKVTASSKAFSTKDSFYVGSPTTQFPLERTPESIMKYINDPKIKYKKFIVVVNSLPALLEVITPDHYADYFLVIDESDSIQMDVGFRDEAMEQCIRFYKLFKPTNRCLVSATPIKHSDPDLTNESITEFDFQTDEGREINLIHTNNIRKTLEKAIDLNRERDPDEKIVIAYNNIEEMKNLAHRLVSNGNPVDEIKILCSSSRAALEKAGSYFTSLESETWPGKINFKTSAYFTGFDIKERYHLIIVVDSAYNANCHSPNRMKQIFGRCRHKDGLFSGTIIFRYVPKDVVTTKTVPDLIEKAKQGIAALNCTTKHLKPLWWSNQEAEIIQNRILDSLTDNGYQLVTKRPDTNDFEVSYLGIDALTEWQETQRKFYSSKNALEKGLKDQKHSVITSVNKLPTDKIDKSKSRPQLESEIEKILHQRDTGIFSGSELRSKEREAVRIFSEHRNNIEKNQLIDLIKKAYSSANSKMLATLRDGLYYATKYETTNFGRALRIYFPVGKKILKPQIKQLVEDVLLIANPNHAKKLKNDSEANGYFRLWIKSHHSRKDELSGEQYFTVQHYNPFGFTITQYKKDLLPGTRLMPGDRSMYYSS